MKSEKFSPDQLRRIEQLRQLAKEKNAVILAHYYTRPEIQEAADFTGDSLALSEKAAQTDADIILFAGVHFMAETAKILSPDKKVLLPDPAAGCSLADSCEASAFAKFLERYPGYTVVSYVNTSVGVKALTDICCTSSNAVEIVRSLPVNAKIVFAPDRNLGNYIQSVTGRDMVVWDGACHVHEEFSLEKIIELKKQYPEAKVLAHPECKKPVLLVADYVGSTAALLNYATQSDAELHKLTRSKSLRYIEPGRARVSLQLPERSQAITLELSVAQWGRAALLEHKLGADKLGQLPYTIYFDLTSGSIELIELPQQ